ncbi:MAG: lysophospholipid acyltransferase family protein [Acidiferrobacterales bacterium]|nr:lysophospholipid acyltransferase family protein [Acidiferrobacterales bacterium]
MDRHYTEPHLKHKFFGLFGSIFWYCSSKLPGRLRWHLGGVLGSALFVLHKDRKSVVMRNLELCFPEVSADERNRTALETFRYAGRGILSWGFALFARQRRIHKEVEWHGRETLNTHLGTGEPLILLCPHFVTPMLTLRSIGELSPVVAMYEPPKNPIFDMGYHCALTGIQSSFGWLNFLYRKRGEHEIRMCSSKGSMRPFFDAMKNGIPFFFLPDQNAKNLKHMVFAPFFGVPAATYTSMSRFIRFRMPRVFLCFSVIKDGGSGYELHTELLPEDFFVGDETEDAQRLNATVEKLIRRAPEQYFWLHRRFKARPAGEPPIY